MAQIKKGFIAPNAIDGSKLRLLNNEAIRALAADGSDVELMKIDVNSVLQFLRTPQVSADPVSGDDVSRKSYVDAEVSAEEARALAAEDVLQENIDSEASARQSADETLQDNIDAEQAARESADAGLQSQIDALSSSSSGDLASETAARIAADEDLQDAIDVEKGRINAILEAATADADTFKEIVDLINSVDTTNDNAFAAYVLSNDAALAQEVSDREAGDSTLQSNLDAEESAREAADSTLQSNIDAEAATRLAADNDLQAAIDQEVSDREAAVSAEQSARESADSALDARLDILEADPTTKTYVDGEVFDLQSQIDALGSSSAGDLAAETAARESADNALDARLDTLEGADTVEGSVAKAEKDAKDHADSIVATEQAAREAADTSLQNQINDILANTDPAALDSLSEIVTAFQQADSDLTDAITSVLGTHTSELNAEVAAREAADATLQSNIDAEESAREAADAALQSDIDDEAAYRQSADDALDARVDALEAVSEGRAKFTITQTDLNNQYVTLSHVAKPDSTFMFYGPLYLHEGDDYTVSTVGGVSRLSFAGRIASGQPSQPIVGDVIYVRYKHSGSGGGGSGDGGSGGGSGDGGSGGGGSGGGGSGGGGSGDGENSISENVMYFNKFADENGQYTLWNWLVDNGELGSSSNQSTWEAIPVGATVSISATRNYIDEFGQQQAEPYSLTSTVLDKVVIPVDVMGSFVNYHCVKLDQAYPSNNSDWIDNGTITITW